MVSVLMATGLTHCPTYSAVLCSIMLRAHPTFPSPHSPLGAVPCLPLQCYIETTSLSPAEGQKALAFCSSVVSTRLDSDFGCCTRVPGRACSLRRFPSKPLSHSGLSSAVIFPERLQWILLECPSPCERLVGRGTRGAIEPTL